MAVGFDIDAQKCTECERCMMACSLMKLGYIQLGHSRIIIRRQWPEPPGINICRFDDCEGQPCIEVCPVEAIANRDGLVLIDRDTCTGCEACVDACPHQAIRMDDENLALKCDFCGGEPACVKECVSEALCKRGV